MQVCTQAIPLFTIQQYSIARVHCQRDTPEKLTVPVNELLIDDIDQNGKGTKAMQITKVALVIAHDT